MIGVRLQGGLGNQMFQYASASGLAHQLETSVAMDLLFYDNIAEGDTPREYELDCFKLDEKFIVASKRPDENSETKYLGKRGALLRLKHLLGGKPWQIYREQYHNFDPQMLKQPDHTYLIGYWQTEKYFSDIREKILIDFSFDKVPSPKNKKLLDEILSSEAVSLHVRRGDYISNKNANEFHGTKDLDYYTAALEPVLKQTRQPKLFVFSDDPVWCKQNLKFSQETVYVEGNTKGSEDMRLMMQCKHNIIANSSFSWWAAWLNQNPDKIVVAPKQWFNDTSVNVSDVIPKTWLTI